MHLQGLLEGQHLHPLLVAGTVQGRGVLHDEGAAPVLAAHIHPGQQQVLLLLGGQGAKLLLGQGLVGGRVLFVGAQIQIRPDGGGFLAGRQGPLLQLVLIGHACCSLLILADNGQFLQQVLAGGTTQRTHSW